MRTADKQIADILVRYGEPFGGNVWRVQGTAVIYHKTLERIAAQAGIVFEPPTIIRAERDEAVLEAPVPGTLVRWLVDDGATVADGDDVAVLDAMKMETTVVAHRSGTLTRAVEEGATTAVGDRLAQVAEVDYVVTTAGSFDLLVEVVCEDDPHLLDVIRRVRELEGVVSSETFVYLKLNKQHYNWGTR